MQNRQGFYDIFVSYSRKDNERGLIEAILAQLGEEFSRFTAGKHLEMFFDKQDIRNGADWQLRIKESLAQSNLFLAFISPEYFASEWCRKEWRLWIDVEIARHILTKGVRPIYIVEVPGLIGRSQLSDPEIVQIITNLCIVSGQSQERLEAEGPSVLNRLKRSNIQNQALWKVESFREAGVGRLKREDVTHILQGLAKDLQEHSDLLAAANASENSIPPYNSKFSGRMDDLIKVRECLCTNNWLGIITGIRGLGGLGKTELAYTYAHAFAHAYGGGRFLIRCEGRRTLQDAVLSSPEFTAKYSHLIDREDQLRPETYFAQIKKHLKKDLESKGSILLVLDNATEKALLAPEETQELTVLGPKLHLLATTRLTASPSARWVQLGELSEAEAIELLEKHRPFQGATDLESARQIIRIIGGFPLFLEVVAAYLAVHDQSSTYAGMAVYLSKNLRGLDEIAGDQDIQLHRHNAERKLSIVLEPALKALSREEYRTMEYAALMPPDHVVNSWLETLILEDFSKILQAPALGEPSWLRIKESLNRQALLTRDRDGDEGSRLSSVHRLVQVEMCNRMRDEGEALSSRRGAVTAFFQSRCMVLKRSNNWKEARLEIEAMNALAQLWNDRNDKNASWFMANVGEFWIELGEWKLAEDLLRKAITQAEAGNDHLVKLETLFHNLGKLLFETDRIQEAEFLFRRSLAIREKKLGVEHPDVAKALNSLAALLRESRRLDEAGALYNRALAITEAHFGMNHKAVGHALNGLVLWLRDSGRLEEAIPLTRRMLDIEIQHLGEDDPEVATARGTLGNMLVQLYQLDEAESLHRRALEVVEKCYGKDHHRVSVVLNNLACCLEAAKRHEEAVPIAERALGILIISYPDGHHKIKDALNNLLIIVKAIELPARSITLMQKVLSEYEQILSEDKIALALQHEELARSLIISKRSGEAIPQLQKALALREQIPGGGPLLGVALNNLGMLLKNVNQLDQAEGLIRRALNVFVEVARNTGTSHPTIQTSIKVYRQILASQGRSELEIRSTLQEIVPDYDPT